MEIIEIIKIEVQKHESNLSPEYVNEISNAIFKQLTEYIPQEKMGDIVELMKPDFLIVVNSLIPIVKEYELKIDQLLASRIDNLISKL